MQNNNLNPKTDLKKRVYIYALKVIKFVDALNKKDLTCRIASDQFLRSATSIGANIIEAQAGSTKKDFINFYTHALKSANECKFWVGLLRDSKRADLNDANKLLQETKEVANMIGASIITLKGKRKF